MSEELTAKLAVYKPVFGSEESLHIKTLMELIAKARAKLKQRELDIKRGTRSSARIADDFNELARLERDLLAALTRSEDNKALAS